MARIRTVKPELAAHEGMYDLEVESGLPMRFAWCMLFTVADREGRFSWRPRTLKAQVLPHDQLDFSRVLDAWLTRGFIVKYRVGHDWFGWIPTFRKHQLINNRESASELPSLEAAEERIDNRNHMVDDASGTREPRDNDASGTREVHAQVEGKEGKEGEGKDACATRESVDPGRFQTGPPTRAGEICRAMKDAGILDVNPSYGKLLDLLGEGAELAEFVQAAKDSVAKGNLKFAYALGMVEGRRRDAAAGRPTGLKGPLAKPEPERPLPRDAFEVARARDAPTGPPADPEKVREGIERLRSRLGGRADGC